MGSLHKGKIDALSEVFLTVLFDKRKYLLSTEVFARLISFLSSDKEQQKAASEWKHSRPHAGYTLFMSEVL